MAPLIALAERFSYVGGTRQENALGDANEKRWCRVRAMTHARA
jgi:hypothetical protein